MFEEWLGEKKEDSYHQLHGGKAKIGACVLIRMIDRCKVIEPDVPPSPVP